MSYTEMLTKNRKINIALVAGVALVTGAYLWYRRRQGNCKMESKSQGKQVLVEDAVTKHCDEGEHRYITPQDPHVTAAERCHNKEVSSHTDEEDESKQMSEIEEVLNDTKMMVLKHMFLVTEGMTTSERLKTYEKLAQKLKVIQRADGIYDVKWRP